MTFSAADVNALNETARDLKIPVEWLIASINFESGGTFDPMIKNPLSSARGLIQFTNATAVSLGYKDSLDLVTKNPSISAQARGPILQYFKKFAPFTNKQDFVFSVFLPKYRKAPLDTMIAFTNPTNQKNFNAANPGIKTVGDYFLKLERRWAALKIPRAQLGGGLVAIALVGLTALIIWKA